MSESILVTGVSSALGVFVSKWLVGRGLNVIGISRGILPFPDFVLPFEVDLGSVDSVKRFCDFASTKKISSIVHCAASVPASNTDEADYWRINCLGLQTLLNGLTGNFHIKSITNISTTAVYCPDTHYAEERTLKIGTSAYGASKYFSECFVETLTRNIVPTVCSIRVPVLLVPKARNNFIAKWVERYKLNQSMDIYNPASNFNSLGDGRTLLNIIERTLDQSIQSGTYNLTPIDTVTVEELACIFCDLLSYPRAKINRLVSSKPSMILSTSRVKSLGVKMYTISESISWYLKSNEIY